MKDTEISEANSGSFEDFREQLKDSHYSIVLIDHLINKIESVQITTFLQINDLFMKQTNSLVAYFTANPSQISLIQNKNPLCLSSIRDYLLKLFRGVHKNFSNNVQQFVEALKRALVSQKKIIKNSTIQLSENGNIFLEQQNYYTVLVYNYSKSVCLALKKLNKKVGNNLVIYVCHGGMLGEGVKMFTELSIEIRNCFIIEDVQATYYMPNIDCVLTGAQAILEDGSIINRAGTYMISLLAQQYKKPVLVFAQSYKFVKKTFLTQKDIPNHLKDDPRRKQPIILVDLIPSRMIKIFCTDVGFITPENLATRMMDLFE